MATKPSSKRIVVRQTRTKRIQKVEKGPIVHISTDMEGICGVTLRAHTEFSDKYAEGQRLMTDETNAAIKGAYEAGASKVIVADSHWVSKNLLKDEVNAPVVPRDADAMLSGCKGCDVTVFLGYHGMAGGDNFMSHTNHEQYFR